MKLTVVLCRQSERWIRKEMWKNRKTLRKVGNYYVSPALLEKGVQIHEAMDVAAPESTLEPAEYPEPHCVPVEQRRDCSHPDWHDREAYIVHHKTRLLEGDRHMCLLTKTIRYEGLPLVLEGGISSLSEDLSEQSREAILQAHLWDCTQIKLPKKLDITKPHWSFPREYGVPIRRKVEMVLAHYNLLCEKVTSQLPGAMDRTILKNLEARVPVQKGDGNLLVLRSLLDTLVTSKEPLAAFSTPEEVRATVEMDLPDLYPVKYTLDLERSNIYKMDTLFPAPRRMMNEHPHTLHVTHPYNYFWFPHQKLARAILACFTFAASRARQLYGDDTLTPPEPIAVQCTYSDINSFGFLAYQLNTLDYENDGGIKNQVWVDGPYELFSECNHDKGLEGYSDQAFQRFLAFYKSGLSSS